MKSDNNSYTKYLCKNFASLRNGNGCGKVDNIMNGLGVAQDKNLKCIGVKVGM